MPINVVGTSDNTPRLSCYSGPVLSSYRPLTLGQVDVRSDWATPAPVNSLYVVSFVDGGNLELAGSTASQVTTVDVTDLDVTIRDQCCLLFQRQHQVCCMRQY
jgi:hypothetical protein